MAAPEDELWAGADGPCDMKDGAGAACGIIGSSEALRRAVDQARWVARTSLTVLITGETGTGKELFARAIHRWSARRDRPLVRVNLGSIPAELFESEFFGHLKGAFTGATRDRLGRFQLAHGATLFLDEIGEIPREQQPKLLRVLQEGELERVGDEHTTQVDVRVIAATNRDLRAEVAAGRFREDLYFRLSTFPLPLPALRDRREDIPELALHFAALARDLPGCAGFGLTHEDLRLLSEFEWPGNVRELCNVVQRFAVLWASGGGFTLAGLMEREAVRYGAMVSGAPGAPGDSTADGAAPGARPLATGPAFVTEREWRELEKQNLQAALERAGGRIYGPGGAAALLGMKPTTLASRLKALGLRRER